MPKGHSLSLSLYTSKCEYLKTKTEVVLVQSSISGPALYYKVCISGNRQGLSFSWGQPQDQLFTTECKSSDVNLRTSSLLQSENLWNQDRGGSCSEVNLRTSSLLQSVDFWEPRQRLSFSWGHSQDQLFTTKCGFLRTDKVVFIILSSLTGPALYYKV